MYGSTQSGTGEGGSLPPRVLSANVPPGGRRLIRIALIAAGVGILLILLSFFRSVYTNWLWFSSVHFLQTYTTILWTRVWLFLVGAVVMGLMLAGSFWWTFRNAWGPTVLPYAPGAYVWVRRIMIGGSAVVGFLISVGFASVLMGRWNVFLAFEHSVSFGRVDPQFGRDVSFYMFTLPVLHIVQGWLMGAIIVALLTSGALYMLIFTVRGLNPFITGPIRTHLAVLGALLLVTIAAAHYLDIFETVFSPDGAVVGATYTDVTARIPALYLLTVVALLGAGLMVYCIRLADLHQAVRLIFAAFGLWAILGVLAGFVWPTLVQRLVVTPSEFQKESTYIQRNITATRYGFGLDNAHEQPFTVSDTSLATDVSDNPATIQNIRLWDPRPLSSVYNQLQHIRLEYQFLDVDVDRYTIDGKYQETMIGGREMFQDGLPPSAQTWVNRNLVYTHGYGVVMSSATQFNPDGEPKFLLQDIPPTGALPVTQPQIYYGESYGLNASGPAPGVAQLPSSAAGVVTNDVAIVNTSQQEFDHPGLTGDAQPIYVQHYDGSGGVPIDSLFRRLMYAWQFNDINILLSNQFTTSSKILYNRKILQRAANVAPFLRFDNNPYLVVYNGKLYWILDAYTTSNRLPYSTPLSSAAIAANTNASSAPTQLAGANYVRNSVKVVINAYDGSMQFYAMVPPGADPLLDVYQSAFPNLFTPLSQMPAGLRAHIRYPESLFLAQAVTYLQYHMTDPQKFYLKEDEWEIPSEVVGSTDSSSSPSATSSTTQSLPSQPQAQLTSSTTRKVEPYYVIMKLPGQTTEEFVLIMPFTPKGKPNLASWMAGRSDGAHYGQLSVFGFPQDRFFDGPIQVEARIDNDPAISQQFTLWGQAGSKVIRGNLLVIPIGHSLLYAEPVYLQASALAFPSLARVILASTSDVVMEPTLNQAVAALLSGQPTTPPAGGTSSGGSGVSSTQLNNDIAALQKALDALQTQFGQVDQSLQALKNLAAGP